MLLEIANLRVFTGAEFFDFPRWKQEVIIDLAISFKHGLVISRAEPEHK